MGIWNNWISDRTNYFYMNSTKTKDSRKSLSFLSQICLKLINNQSSFTMASLLFQKMIWMINGLKSLLHSKILVASLQLIYYIIRTIIKLELWDPSKMFFAGLFYINYLYHKSTRCYLSEAIGGSVLKLSYFTRDISVKFPTFCNSYHF